MVAGEGALFALLTAAFALRTRVVVAMVVLMYPANIV